MNARLTSSDHGSGIVVADCHHWLGSVWTDLGHPRICLRRGYGRLDEQHSVLLRRRPHRDLRARRTPVLSPGASSRASFKPYNRWHIRSTSSERRPPSSSEVAFFLHLLDDPRDHILAPAGRLLVQTIMTKAIVQAWPASATCQQRKHSSDAKSIPGASAPRPVPSREISRRSRSLC